ncbi:di-heme-cytochrome C peroxidase [Azospirillum sp. B4]|uniref:di-heme-cytochrome C peroxidase n=1 Tax=Azospirillum sp. B4 TaxID=95605 RepID=UPI000349AEB3|nr:di-heme-cytochrome C peroxidase [Azospirillum sp. B4]
MQSTQGSRRLAALPLTALLLLTSCGGSNDTIQIGTSKTGTLPLPSWSDKPATGAVQRLPTPDTWGSWYGIDQGWTLEQRQAFWFTPQGSWMIPYGWLLALEQSGSETPFIAPENMARLGYIPAPKSVWNPDGLPIGFTVSPPLTDKNGKPGIAWAGPNCAACHSNEVTYQGKAVIIDGAPSLADFYHLNMDMLDALVTTSEQPAKFDRFVKALVERKFLPADTPQARNELQNQMAEHEMWLSDYLKHNLCGDSHGGDCLGGQSVVDTARASGGSTYEAYLANNRAVRESLTAEAKTEPTKAINRDEVYHKGYVPLPGNGRIDAIGAIFNQVTGPNIAVAHANYSPSNAPVSYPFLWGAPQSDRVQWNGFGENTSVLGLGVGPLGRNVGEVLGVYGRVDVRPRDPSQWTTPDGSFETLNLPTPTVGFANTVLTNNLGHLEKWLSGLRSPRWPEGVLPPIDKALAQAGEAIYTGKSVEGVNCASCHQPVKFEDEGKSYDAVLVQTSVVGTDPAMADNYMLERNTQTTNFWKSGKLEGKSQNVVEFWKSYGPTLDTRAVALVDQVAGVLFSDMGKTIAAARLSKTYSGSVPDIGDQRSYKARPLTGIWATAPYLHNGSVPSLAQLLTPAEDRVPTFHVGNREFDPVDVGYSTAEDGSHPTYEFDTRLPGNKNAGHTGHAYGTELSADQKKALIEYLKTL